jgi:hypothetical protein
VPVCRLDELQKAMPDDVPSLKSTCHLLPLELPSQVVFYAKGNRVGVTDTPDTPCVRTNRLRLREVLSTNIPIQWGKEAVSIKEDENSVTVTFQDGQSATGDVLVGADGTFSFGKTSTTKEDKNTAFVILTFVVTQ